MKKYVKQVKFVEVSPSIPGCNQTEADLTDWINEEDIGSEEDALNIMKSLKTMDDWATKKMIIRYIEI